MLRFLVFLSFFVSVFTYAENSEYVEPSKEDISDQKARLDSAFTEADSFVKEGGVSEIINKANRDIPSLDSDLSGINITMPSYLDEARDDNYMKMALKAAGQIEENRMVGGDVIPIVLISSSMPKSQIVALSEEAQKVGAAISFRGLIDDDFNKTVDYISSMSSNIKGGIGIDPTAFRRFSVTRVPAFILPLEPLEPCSNDGCPSVSHVKAFGSASLKYFLELVSRVGTSEEKLEADKWIKQYEQ